MLTDSRHLLGPILAGHNMPLQTIWCISRPAVGGQTAAVSLWCHCRFQAYPDTCVFSRLLPSDHLHTAVAVGYGNGKFTLRFVVSRENDWCWLDTELLTSPADGRPVPFASPGTSSNSMQKSPIYSPFYARSQNCETPPLASSCPAPTGRILIKCDTWVFFENLWRKFKFH